MISQMMKLRPKTEPFEHFLSQARELGRFWAKFAGATVAFSLVFGPFAPLGIVAALLTLGLPILLLVLWGRSLDAELGWTEIEEGPW